MTLVLLAVFLLGLGARLDAAEQQTAESTNASASATPTPPPPTVIPVEKIALRATEVANLLDNFAADFVPGIQVEAIRESLPSAREDVTLKLEDTLSMLKEQPSFEALQAQEQVWQRRQLQLTAWLNVLTDRAAKLEDGLRRLMSLQEIWERTRDAGRTADAPAPTLQQIDTTLAAIEAAQPRYRAQRDDALDLQSQVAQEVGRCQTARTQIAHLQQSAVGKIFARDSPPIWSPDLWRQAQAALPARVARIAASYWADIRMYVREPSKGMPLHLGLFVLAFVALLAARGQVDQWAADGEPVFRIAAVFDHPFAAALLLALMVATGPASPIPLTVSELFSAVALVPMIVLARPVVSPTLVSALYTLGILFWLDTVRHAFAGIPSLVGQLIILLASLAGSVVLAWLLVRGRLHRATGAHAEAGRQRIRRFAAGLLFLVLTIGFLASALGYLRLARLTTPAVLVGGADALWLYAAVGVATGVIAYLMRVWPLRRLHMVEHHRYFLQTRIHRLLVWGTVAAWCFRYLDYLGLWDPALAFANALLTTRFERGTFSISAGDVLGFFLTLWIAYLLSAFLRFVLEEEVYPRVRITAGISYAVSSLLSYVIVALAFLLALGLLGVTLTQVTVLAGAFGVGIGLGLQSVVNNFVSGLILLFERPIHVGDAVQAGDLQGWVRRIGIRASVVRTVQGAEVIIPNAQLVTQEVTNWTLSDQLRRLDLPVGVSYGAAPRRVIELLENVARGHPQVMQNPPPRGLFMGYGDSSINFELRAWTEYANWVNVQSDLTVAIYDAVYAAGMSFPFPQREVRLLSDHTAGPADPGSSPDDKAQ